MVPRQPGMVARIYPLEQVVEYFFTGFWFTYMQNLQPRLKETIKAFGFTWYRRGT